MQKIMLDDLFFAICQTAIQNCAWKRGDFEAVKRVEGQLDALRNQLIASQPEQPQIERSIPEMSNEPETGENPQIEQPVAPVLTPEVASPKLVSPEEAKNAPERPMPEEILDAVKDGIELAKNPPKVANVKVEALSSNPDEARNQFNKNF